MTYEEFLTEWRDNKNFIFAQTSGSTGEPKIIRLKKDFMSRSAIRTNEFFNINSSSRLHSCISPDFIGGKMMAVRSEIARCRLSWEIPSNTPLKNLSSSEKLSLVALVPSQMHYIIDNKSQMPVIDNLLIGGSPIPPLLKDKIIECGLNAYESYGMTETASHIALRKVTSENIPFTTLPGISVSASEEECLVILFDTGEKFVTNDIVQLVSDTAFFIKGRKDNVIISGGKKINPIELEAKISSLLPYAFCITGFPDDKWGEKVVLILESKTKCINTDYILELLKPKLEKWEMPKEIIIEALLARTANGKIIRPKNRFALSSFGRDNNPAF